MLSITTDAKNLFDPNIGMYVPGNSPGGNFFQRGDDWERRAHLDFFEPDGRLGFEHDIGLKIHGNTSRQFPQKGLSIRARYESSRQPIRYQIFPDKQQFEFERFILRQSGHDYYLTFMRDAMMQRLVEELGVETQAYRPAILFINGEYWGIHEIREAEDKYFIAAKSGADPENIDYLEGYAAANEGDLVHYQNMLSFLENNDIRLDENYLKLQGMMDVQNYLDYKIPETFYYRWDIGNHRLWRPRTPEGRWRWLHFDNDVGWGGFWSVPPAWSFNMLAYNTEPNGPWTQFGGNDHNNPTVTYLLRRLLQNSTFKHDFINRFADLLNTTFEINRVTNIINEMAAVIAPEMPEHIQRWRAPESMTEWRANVNYLHEYAQKRPGFARQHILQKFGLRGTAKLTLSINDIDRGTLRLNFLTLAPPASKPWKGIYFNGNPITVIAQPRPGFQFVQWQGIPGQTTNQLTLLLNGDLTLHAEFAPSAPPRIDIRQINPGQLELTGTAAPAATYFLELSEDFKSWIQAWEVTATSSGELSFPFQAQGSALFLRLRLK